MQNVFWPIPGLISCTGSSAAHAHVYTAHNFMLYILCYAYTNTSILSGGLPLSHTPTHRAGFLMSRVPSPGHSIECPGPPSHGAGLYTLDRKPASSYSVPSRAGLAKREKERERERERDMLRVDRCCMLMLLHTSHKLLPVLYHRTFGILAFIIMVNTKYMYFSLMAPRKLV